MLIAVGAALLLGLAPGTAGGVGAVLAVPVLVCLLVQSVHAATAVSLLVVAGAAGAVAAFARCSRMRRFARVRNQAEREGEELDPMQSLAFVVVDDRGSRSLLGRASCYG